MVGGGVPTHTIHVTDPSQGPCSAPRWRRDGAWIPGNVHFDPAELPGYVGDRPADVKANCWGRRKPGARPAQGDCNPSALNSDHRADEQVKV